MSKKAPYLCVGRFFYVISGQCSIFSTLEIINLLINTLHILNTRNLFYLGLVVYHTMFRRVTYETSPSLRTCGYAAIRF